MVVSFENFGHPDRALYEKYLRAVESEERALAILRSDDVVGNLRTSAGDIAGCSIQILPGNGGYAGRRYLASGSGGGECSECGATQVDSSRALEGCEQLGDADGSSGDCEADDAECSDDSGCVGGGPAAGGVLAAALGASTDGQRCPSAVVAGDVRVGPGGSLPPPGAGKNWARNREWREAAKEKKRRRREAKAALEGGVDSVPVWRRGAAANVPVGAGDASAAVARVGYFSSCSADVQAELVRTRAEALIAKNKRTAAVEAAKLRDMTGAHGVLRDLLRVVRSSEELQKRSKDEAIHGWARTIADSAQKSLADSAAGSDPSLPSLDEVGFGRSAGSGVASDASKRQSQYQARYSDILEAYDAMPWYDPFERADELKALKLEYADLFMAPDVAVKTQQKVRWDEMLPLLKLRTADKNLIETLFAGAEHWEQ